MKERKYTVYMHTNKINNKVYVGITSGKAKQRWNGGRGYLNKNKNGNYHQPLMANAVLKYDWDNDWDHIIFAEGLSREVACYMEKMLIKLYHTNHREYGYNLSKGGEKGAEGCKRSAEYCRRMSEQRKGWTPTDEWRKKQSDAHTGKKISDDTKLLLAQSKLGHNNPMFGKSGREHHNSMPVCQCDTDGNFINFFWNCNEAERFTGINFRNIHSICSGYVTKSGYKRKTAGGYRWRYATSAEIYEHQGVVVC